MSVREPEDEQKTEEEIGGVDRDPQETSEWIEAFEQLRVYHGEERAHQQGERTDREAPHAEPPVEPSEAHALAKCAHRPRPPLEPIRNDRGDQHERERAAKRHVERDEE